MIGGHDWWDKFHKVNLLYKNFDFVMIRGVENSEAIPNNLGKEAQCTMALRLADETYFFDVPKRVHDMLTDLQDPEKSYQNWKDFIRKQLKDRLDVLTIEEL